MATPSRIRVHRYDGEIQLTMPGGRRRWHLRQIAATPFTYEVIVHRLKPNGWIGRREAPVRFTGEPLRKMLHFLADRAGMEPFCWLRCLRIPAEAGKE